MRLMRAATLTVSNLKNSQALYCEWFNYTCIEEGQIGQELAESWGAAQTVGAAYCILQPASEANVFIRLIQQPEVNDYKALKSYGWAAIEICCEDTLAVNERMKRSPFEIIGPPKELDSMPEIFPMQVKGPDEEIIFLTEIRANLEGNDLPRAASLIDKLFILVLACSNIEASGKWLEKHLLISKGPTIEIIYTMINKAFNFSDKTKHAISVLKHGRDAFIEIDQYPSEAHVRPQHQGMLPPCAAIGTFAHPDFDKLLRLNKGLWITPPAQRSGPIYKDKRVGTLRAPDGSLVEIVEA